MAAEVVVALAAQATFRHGAGEVAMVACHGGEVVMEQLRLHCRRGGSDDDGDDNVVVWREH